MKRWLKRNGRRIWLVAAFLCLSFLSYCVVTTRSDAGKAVAVVGIAAWIMLLLLEYGVLKRIYDWWEKD